MISRQKRNRMTGEATSVPESKDEGGRMNSKDEGGRMKDE
jgi:hypothetical protein